MNKKLLATSICACFLAFSGIAFAGEAKKCDKPCEKKAPVEHVKAPECGKMNKMRAEMEQRLQLTEEQKCEIKKLREKTHKKLEKIAKQERKLAKKRHEIMKNDKEAFEAVLTDAQKIELKKMAAEKKAEMKKKFDEAKQPMHKKGCKCPKGVKKH